MKEFGFREITNQRKAPDVEKIPLQPVPVPPPEHMADPRLAVTVCVSGMVSSAEVIHFLLSDLYFSIEHIDPADISTSVKHTSHIPIFDTILYYFLVHSLCNNSTSVHLVE